MRLKPVIAFALLLLLSGCGTLKISVDYGNTAVPETPESTSNFAATFGAIHTWTPTPTISPTATETATPAPTEIVTVPADRGVIAVTSNQDHTCALTGTGKVVCWGNNEYGQLGDGTVVNSNLPVEVTGVEDAVVVAAGWRHTCALTRSGGVKCWGYNRNGELGNGKNTNSSLPDDVQGLSDGITSIGVGDDHACAVTEAGAVKCWGYNDYGQLGDGTKIARNVPVDVQGIIPKVLRVVGGWGHTCILVDGGGVKCWGNNEYGQLGYGQDADLRLTAVDVLESTYGITAISAGGAQTCLMLPGGKVRCWGRNKYGQLGDGTGESRNSPVDVSGLDQGVERIVAGWNHTCAMMGNGELKCWGWNYFGQLGNGNQTTQSKPADVKRLMENVKDVAVGYSHTCAVTVSGGVKCWGSNQYGQLGDGTNIDSSVPLIVNGLGGSASSSAWTQTATPAELTSTSSEPTGSSTPTHS